MPKKNQTIIAQLESESARFTELAKDIALDLLKNPFAPDVEKKKRKAEDHLIRAEVYKDAASLIAKNS